jgi:23S rRNA (uridine2552-2'-O)-methyltransferase
VFKLEELDRKHTLIGKGDRVLDLGCRPGSLLQYAARQGAGALVGLDRQPLDVTIPGARILVGDVLEMPAETLRGDLAGFDVVLSDMAPDTSGIRAVDQARSETLFERALELAILLLAPGGHFVGKLFQGPDMKRLVERARAHFGTVKLEKPAGSRKESIEVYVVGIGRRPRT